MEELTVCLKHMTDENINGFGVHVKIHICLCWVCQCFEMLLTLWLSPFGYFVVCAIKDLFFLIEAEFLKKVGS